MKKIEAKVVADSICNGHRITTMLCTFPRFILSEVNTHRMFSRNSASSRAIPFEKMVKMVEEDPFIPIAWQKDHKGMQGTEYLNNEELKWNWLEAKDHAVELAKILSRKGVTKQICNRLLEPFMWHTCLITATEWENFFELRCPQYRSYDRDSKVLFRSKKDFLKFKGCPNDPSGILYFLKHNESQAEIHIQALAESMWDAMNESVPKELKEGEWHIPFGGQFDFDQILSADFPTEDKHLFIKIATARCARLSYNNFDGEIDYKKDIELHDRLLKDGHLSPFEHCARALTEDESDFLYKSLGESDESFETGWCDNFRGWMSYRFLIEKGE